MNSFTLRRIPSPVERSLRRIARESHQSLNKTAIELLARAAGIGYQDKKSRKRRDVSGAFPGWSMDEYREFQNNTKQFGSIDEDLWHS